MPRRRSAQSAIAALDADDRKLAEQFTAMVAAAPSASTTAQLDDGDMWPTAFALNRLSPADEKKLAALVTKAAAPARRPSTTG